MVGCGRDEMDLLVLLGAPFHSVCYTSPVSSLWQFVLHVKTSSLLPVITTAIEILRILASLSRVAT